MNLKDKKILIIVSTGRCGTVRLTEILTKNLSDSYYVAHQQNKSRKANVLGNLFYYVGSNEKFKIKIYTKNLNKTTKSKIIITDPLISMMIPEEMIFSENVAIFHIFRDSLSFGKSFYQFSRKKVKSFIAHNFIPFWQIGIFPFQNILFGKKMINSYKKTADKKNKWFIEKYSKNKYFVSISMKEVFNSDKLEKYLNHFFASEIKINANDFLVKSNTSK